MCDVTDDEIIRLEPTLELDGRLPMDSNGYYRLELRQDVHQTIHWPNKWYCWKYY